MTGRTVGTVLVLVFSAAAQHQGTAPGPISPGKAAEAAHHACLDQERAALERGEGFGMAMAADRNGFPGPRHVLELRAELKLTPEQQSAIEDLFRRMKQRALARGKEALVAEQNLDAMFAGRRPEAELREQAFRVATLRAELRWVHLSAHLAAQKLLSPEQLAAYQHLRHSGHPGASTSESR
jgi:Spy/CpxP family protein refolding chaperone